MTKQDLDTNTKTELSEALKKMIKDNPIDQHPNLLISIIEPIVNEIISDYDIPKKIKELIDIAIVPNHELKEKIHEAINDAVISEMSEQNSEVIIQDAVERNLETDESKELIKTTIENSVDSREVSDKLEEAVGDVVSHEISGTDICNMVEELIGEMLAQEHIDEYIKTEIINQLYLEDTDHQHYIRECIQERIKELVTKEETTQIVKDQTITMVDGKIEKEEIDKTNDIEPENTIQIHEFNNWNTIIINFTKKELTDDIVKLIQIIVKPIRLQVFPKKENK